MRKQHPQQGVALIELALAVPLMLLLSMIVIEFGRALYEYNTVTKSARDAVRYLSTKTLNTEDQTPAILCADAKKLVVYGRIGTGSTPLAPGLKTGGVSCNWQTTGSLPLIDTVTVTVTGYRFKSMVSNVFGTRLTDGGITFGPISATMRTQT